MVGRRLFPTALSQVRVAPVLCVVALVSLANAVGWSFLTPVFQVPDETAHVAYVQHIAQTGTRAGRLGRPEFSTEQIAVMAAVGTNKLIGRPDVRTPTSSGTVAKQIKTAEGVSPRGDGGGISSASSQPPLYYGMAAAPYLVFSNADLVTRIHAVRLFSAVLFALAAVCCATLAADFFPTHRWAPYVGGLAIGLSPYSAFIGSGVTPDALLLAISAASSVALSRILRTSLTRRRALLLGLLLGAGSSTKLIFLAFVPPALVAVAFVLVSSFRAGTLRMATGLQYFAMLLGAAAALPLAGAAWTVLSATSQGGGGEAASAAVVSGGQWNVREIVSYAWQLFLPRLPFMTDQFAYSPLRATWSDGFAGRYGWLDYSAPAWVNSAFFAVLAAIAALSISAAVLARHVLKVQLLQGVTALSLLAALGLVMAKTGIDYRRSTGFVFEQARYLFGLVGCYTIVITGACLGLGRRFAPGLGMTLVVLLCIHNASGLAVTAVRYYG